VIRLRGCDDVIAGTQSLKDAARCRQPGAKRRRISSALQRRHRLLERPAIRIIAARVNEPERYVPSASRSNVVESWIGAATAPVAGSVACPAWTAIVSIRRGCCGSAIGLTGS
jgi:hypothetical protein